MLALLAFLARAEGRGETDCSGDLGMFCRAVASLNHTPEAGGLLRAARPTPYIVLCRARGGDPGYGETDPDSVILGPDGRAVLAYSSREAADAAVAWLNGQPAVLYAEHDSTVDACGTEGVSFRSAGAESLNLGGYLRLARDWGEGSQLVAVIDSGVSMHSLLRDRIGAYGYDYVDADADPTNDLSGHGTHVAGIIADCTSGAPVRLYPIRVLNRTGSGKMSNVVAAVLEAADAGADVINLSLESSEMSEALDDAIEAAVAGGATVVAAAGNQARDTRGVCPAHLTGEGIVVVGSAEASEAGFSRSDYSNYGDSVDLYAFGSNIESCSRSGGFVVRSGTSMAAAHVSGVCALMGLTHPGLSPRGIERRLRSVCVGDDPRVLDATGLVPVSEGFRLASIVLDEGGALRLPVRAEPSTSDAEIAWRSADEGVVSVDSTGLLRAEGAGFTALTAKCIGFDDVCIAVTVEGGDGAALTLPEGVRRIGDEAFMDSGAGHIVVPEGVEAVGDRAFAHCPGLRTVALPEGVGEIGEDALAGSTRAIILCAPGSAAEVYAIEHELQYIALSY